MAQSKYSFSLNEALANQLCIDYLIIDVIGLQQESSTYRNSSLTCQVLCGGKKIGDLSLARKDHELQVPLGRAEDNLQLIIFPMTNPKARVGKYKFFVLCEMCLNISIFRKRKYPSSQLPRLEPQRVKRAMVHFI